MLQPDSLVGLQRELVLIGAPAMANQRWLSGLKYAPNLHASSQLVKIKAEFF